MRLFREQGIIKVVAITIATIYLFANYFQLTIPYYMAMAAIMLLWFYFILATSRISRNVIRDQMPLLVFTLILLLSAIWSIDRSRTFYQMLGLVFFVWFSYLVMQIGRSRGRAWSVSLAVILIIGIFILFIISKNRFGAVRIISKDMREAVGTFSNFGGAILVLCIPFVIYGFQSRSISKVTCIIILLVAAWSILQSASRAAYGLSVIVVVTCLLWGSRSPIKILRNIGYLVILSIMAVYIVSNNPSLNMATDRVLDRVAASSLIGGSTVYNTEVDSDRVNMLREAEKIISNRPLLGIGYQSFSEQFKKDFGFSLISHNILINAWAEAGILGLLSFLWLMSAAFWRTWRNLRSSSTQQESLFYKATFVALTAAMIHAMFRPQFNNPMFFVVLGFALTRHSKLGVKSGVKKIEPRVTSHVRIVSENQCR